MLPVTLETRIKISRGQPFAMNLKTVGYRIYNQKSTESVNAVRDSYSN
jgi:hypothetical protein